MRWKCTQYLSCLFSLFFLLMASQAYARVCYRPMCQKVVCCPKPKLWQGFYLSGQLGGGWSRFHAEFENHNFFTTGSNHRDDDFTIKTCGFIGGGTVGYNFQCGPAVFGIEGGALALHLEDKECSPFFSSDNFHHHNRWLATVKGRLGFAFDCWLFYINGGWAGVDTEVKLCSRREHVVAKRDRWANGCTFGGGIDYKLWQCVSVGVAYDYTCLDFDDKKLFCQRCGVEGGGFGRPKIDSCANVQTLLLKLNYHFNL